jgi:hypothetical protein
VIIVTTILNNKAHQNPSTWKPGTIALANNTNKAFITSKKSPRVNTVTGKDNITNIGLIKIFTKAKTAAAKIAVKKLATLTPGRIKELITIAIAERKSLIIEFITEYYHKRISKDNITK